MKAYLVRKSPIHGTGVFAARDIAKDEEIVYYEGRIITHDEAVDPKTGIRVTEEREGKVLLSDPQYPFEALKKHGQRFAAHFRLKKVNSPFLRHLAIIDTPGIRSFGLAHVKPEDLIEAFPDLDELTEDCPRGCTHGTGEPECGLDEAVADGRADPDRVSSFRRLLTARSEPVY